MRSSATIDFLSAACDHDNCRYSSGRYIRLKVGDEKDGKGEGGGVRLKVGDEQVGKDENKGKGGGGGGGDDGDDDNSPAVAEEVVSLSAAADNDAIIPLQCGCS